MKIGEKGRGDNFSSICAGQIEICDTAHRVSPECGINKTAKHRCTARDMTLLQGGTAPQWQ
jgi:hypothetical protein